MSTPIPSDLAWTARRDAIAAGATEAEAQEAYNAAWDAADDAACDAAIEAARAAAKGREAADHDAEIIEALDWAARC